MLFPSVVFLFYFLPLFIVIYCAAPGVVAKNVVLLAASLLSGLRIFVIGLAQKVLVADEVSRIAETVFDKLAQPTMAEAWLGLSAYTIQIYFDFAGYSNMAIGLALALGFPFPRNFNLPYASRSITEFWRRWHISLSQWLRDYLYIPLGGNRGARAATYRNLCLVFLVCGTWHGANWTFIIWGVHHGAFLIAERAGVGSALARAPAWAARLYALAAIMSGWVWFRARDLDHALSFFASLAGVHGISGLSVATQLVTQWAAIAALVAGAALAVAVVDVRRLFRLALARWAGAAFAVADTVVVGLFFALSILNVAAGSYSPFLYFRF
jgi:alginate O-acetyltransferase complex protein AlgI